MQQEQRAIRAGMTALVFALVMRLLTGVAGPVAEFLAQPEQAAFLLYLQTGRNIRPAITPKETLPAEAPPTTEPIAETTAPREDVMEFSPEDAQLVQVSNLSGLSVDPEALLLTQLARAWWAL